MWKERNKKGNSVYQFHSSSSSCNWIVVWDWGALPLKVDTGAWDNVVGDKMLLGGSGLAMGLESGVMTCASPCAGASWSSSRREDGDGGRGVSFSAAVDNDGGGVGNGDKVDVVDDEGGGNNA